MKGEKGGDRRKIQEEKQGGLDSKVCGTSGATVEQTFSSPLGLFIWKMRPSGSIHVSPSEETTGRFEVNQDKAL